MELCKCGCGRLTDCGDWVRGHWNRGNSESKRKAWKKRRELYGPSGVNVKSWIKRLERYPTGYKDIEAYREKMRIVNNDPVAIKIRIETRRKNDPNGESWSQAWRTRVERYGPSGGNEDTWDTRRKNDPTNESAKRTVETRRLNDPEGKRFQKSWKTRRERDPENLSAQKGVKTRTDLYGPSGCKNPEIRKTAMINTWADPEKRKNILNGMATIDQKESKRKMWIKRLIDDPSNEWINKIWANYTSEEREIRIYNTAIALNIRPNRPEKRIIDICSQYNIPFKYTGDKPYPGLGGKMPDFVYEKENKIIEHCGNYWHTEDETNDRIKYFRQLGYSTLILWEHEMKISSDEEIATGITEFLTLESLNGGITW